MYIFDVYDTVTPGTLSAL